MKTVQFLLILATLVGPGCSVRTAVPPEPCVHLEDRTLTPQDLLALTGLDPDRRFLSDIPMEHFSVKYFAVFRAHDEPETSKRWAWLAFGNGGLLLDNLQPASPRWFAGLDEEAMWGLSGSVDRPGVALVTTSLRSMPSDRLLIGDSAQPGRDSAFDLLQNSLVNANEPLWISHRSLSGEWTFVFTSYASGWLPSRDVAAVPKGHELAWPLMTPVVCIDEGFPVHDSNGVFLFVTRVGMVLPSVGTSGSGSDVLLVTSRDAEGVAGFEVATLPGRVAVTVPMTATFANAALVAARLLDLPYGWGGLHGHRDCSAAIRDLMAPFGLWLPRNSREQAAVGETVDLVGLGDDDKVDLILSRGVPFATILYKKGHVALYIGHSGQVPLVFHSVWDLASDHGGAPDHRHIGRIVISPLRSTTSADSCSEGSTLLADLQSMSILSR